MRSRSILRIFFRTIEASARKRLGLYPRPYKLLLELTEKCNSRCQHCKIWEHDDDPQELQVPIVEKLFRDSGKDLVWLALAGGEVTLARNFKEITALATRYCPNLSIVTFTTNGLWPERAVELAKLLQGERRDLFVTVSLDGDEATHDRIRGIRGNHARALKTYQLLRAAGVQAHFGITLSDENADFARSGYADYRDSMKAVTFVHSGGIYKTENTVSDETLLKSIESLLLNYKARTLGEILEKAYLRLGRRFFQGKRERSPIPCEVIHTSLHAMAGGEVLPCMFMPALGNLQEASLKEILSTEKTRKTSEQIAKGNCPRCWMNCYAPHSMMMHPVRSLISGARVRSSKEIRT